MIKYYFGYHKFNGLWFPFKWMEEHDTPVGGVPMEIVDKRSITGLEFNYTHLQILVQRYPRMVVEEKPEPPG
jgi:hypothetical protein